MKEKIDECTMELTKDRQGYTAFSFILKYKDKFINRIMISGCSHEKADEKIGNYIRKNYQVENLK